MTIYANVKVYFSHERYSCRLLAAIQISKLFAVADPGFPR